MMDLPTLFDDLGVSNKDASEVTMLGRLSTGKYYAKGTLFLDSIADSTKRSYRRVLDTYLHEYGYNFPILDEYELVDYIERLAEKNGYSTIKQRLSALKFAHDHYGYAFPNKTDRVKRTLKGLKRNMGTKVTKVKPMRLYDLFRVLDRMGERKLSDTVCRDAALLTTGFLCLLRREEISLLKRGDIEITDDGMVVSIPPIKFATEEERVFINRLPEDRKAHCSVRFMERWLARFDYLEDSKPLFLRMTKHGSVMKSQMDKRLSGEGVRTIIKNAFRLASIKEWDEFSGHSLRRGFATQAHESGMSLIDIQMAGRWQDLATVALYIEVTKSKAVSDMTDLM